MTWHRIWGIKCNNEGCTNIFVTDNPSEDPTGWVSDGTSHLCEECVAKKAEEQAVSGDQEPVAEAVEEQETVALS